MGIKVNSNQLERLKKLLRNYRQFYDARDYEFHPSLPESEPAERHKTWWVWDLDTTRKAILSLASDAGVDVSLLYGEIHTPGGDVIKAY
jgi:hypothetical protein